MLVHRDINQLPSFKNSVITIGTFDGVHTGHLKIIGLLKEESQRVNGESVIITFHPHPRMIVGTPAQKSAAEDESRPVKPVALLNTLEEKISLIAKLGIDHLVIVPFTETFSLLSAEDYIEKFLVEKFRPHTIIIGHDHRFGKQRHGNYRLLEEHAATSGYIVKEIPEHIINDVVISSTMIRKAVASGDIETANKCLGYTFFFGGHIVEGDKVGRKLGFPTANVQPDNESKILPADGVYAVQVSLTGKSNKSINQLSLKEGDELPTGVSRWNGMMNIGYRPTVGGTRKLIEVHIFDFDEDIYGAQIRVSVQKYLRAEKKFDGLGSLKAQLDTDRLIALDFFAENGS